MFEYSLFAPLTFKAVTCKAVQVYSKEFTQLHGYRISTEMYSVDHYLQCNTFSLDTDIPFYPKLN